MIEFLVLLIVVTSAIGGIYKLSKPTAVGELPKGSSFDAIPLQPKVPPLSRVAREVLDEYNSLPVESRPFDNIEDILASLDAVTNKFGKDKRDDHFDDNLSMRAKYRSFHSSYSQRTDLRYGDKYPYSFSWNANNGVHCSHNDGVCRYADYVALHREITAVKEALAKKAEALVESENAHNVSMARELAQALRIEAGIQTQVTNEIRG